MRPRRSSLFRQGLVAWLRAGLRRIGRGLRSSRVAAGTVAAPSPKPTVVTEAAPLRRALRRLLDLAPGSRHVLRHLGYVERALAKQGTQALDEVPVEVMATALAQLEAVVSNWSDRDLADLRSRMAVAVRQRSEEAVIAPAGARLSDFASASRLLVGDVAHSVFEELQRQYEGLLPPERIQAALTNSATPTASGQAG